MKQKSPEFGFSYFSSPKYYLHNQLVEWMTGLYSAGASAIIFRSDFDRGIPEDAFLVARDNNLEPIVHFTAELPKAKALSEISILFDTYQKRGVQKIILGDRPNIKQAWPSGDWHNKNLVQHFVDRFIPLASYAVQIGLSPVFPPLQPGGDFWDTSFFELVVTNLKNRKMSSILNHIILSSYGFSFGKPLSWGKGGPERWSGSKPYHTPDGQENQMGFHNFSWIQAIAERHLGHSNPIMVLDAGFNGESTTQENSEQSIKDIRLILNSLSQKNPAGSQADSLIDFGDSVVGCYFSLAKFNEIMEGNLSLTKLWEVFDYKEENNHKKTIADENKLFSYYLLLPSHADSVSDVVLNKVRPVIKKYRPAVGFSLDEASYAEKVIIYPDPVLFSQEKINQLRASGCKVEILPESGIEIATRLQGS